MIEVEHLTKRYGDFTAVKDLSFTIDDGHVYGFLGPNGAGKSTTMNIMTGCLSASEGHVRIDGHDIFEEPNEAKKCIGYLPEQPPLYLSETPEEYLRFVGEAKGLRGAELKRQIEQVLEETKLTEMRHRRISALSKGYKQRVGIAQAILGDPKVIILDEPTVGLDPIQIIEIRDLIHQLGQAHTVILSSHILSEVQAICDKILIIAHGQLVAFDDTENMEAHLAGSGEISLTADAPEDETRAILAQVEHITRVQMESREPNLTSARLETDSDDIYAVSRALFFAFAGAGKALVELTVKKATLEDVFIELTETASAQEPTPEEPDKTPNETPNQTSDKTDRDPEESEVTKE